MRGTGLSFTRHVGLLSCISFALLALACTRTTPVDPSQALSSITEQNLATDVNELASDTYEGRQPGTHGEDLTVAYIERRFRAIGAAPGNPDGSYVQRVPLVGITSTPIASLTVRGQRTPLETPRDFVARSTVKQDRAAVQSELVFVGYGIQAPEYGWNDYRGADVKGKIVLVMLGEPSRPAPNDPTGTDPGFFKGVEESYYGTPRYKRDEAARRGAAAAVFILGPEVDYEAVTGNFHREALDIDQSTSTSLMVEAAMPSERLGPLVARAGQNLGALMARARQPGFRAVPFGMTLALAVDLQRRSFVSRNVVAKIAGGDPRLRDEYIVYTAHWDALGRDATLDGDQIKNGAIDNAIGIGQILAIAQAFRKLPAPPRRSILLIATTAEEAGLLGARYYARNPLYPLDRTVASINLDNSFPFGRTSDVINFGEGRSELDDVLREVAATQKRTVTPDPFPAEGFYFRWDQFEFANVGIPGLSPAMGNDVVGKTPGYGKEMVEEYLQRDYHQVTDEVRPDWDYSGAVQDAQLDFLIGVRVAGAERWPQWKPGAEFRPHAEAVPAAQGR